MNIAKGIGSFYWVYASQIANQTRAGKYSQVTKIFKLPHTQAALYLYLPGRSAGTKA